MVIDQFALEGSIADYLNNKKGRDLLTRLQPLADWINCRYDNGVDPFCKSSEGAILPTARIRDRKGKFYTGINFINQDYLSLSSHEKVKQAAIEAVNTYGVHSAGSPTLSGYSSASLRLERKLSQFLNYRDCITFPTGWSAAYGLIRCLIDKNDYILIDQLAHASLVDGATCATGNVQVFRHLSIRDLERRLQRIRQVSDSAGILIITESLFSMDSDTPDLRAHQELARKYHAMLMVDAAHDLGCIGPNGGGFIEKQGMTGAIDLVMGSFSKTFASNGGFVATNNPALRIALLSGASPLVFSNAISQIQASVVSMALDIVCSSEGQELRRKLLSNSERLRALLVAKDFEVLGVASAVVPVLLGTTRDARLISKFTLDNGGLVNLVEYPAVSKKTCRFRLQVMANHSNANLNAIAEIVSSGRQSLTCDDDTHAQVALWS